MQATNEIHSFVQCAVKQGKWFHCSSLTISLLALTLNDVYQEWYIFMVKILLIHSVYKLYVCNIFTVCFNIFFLQLKESKPKISEQTIVVDESTKMFLEELVTDVCKSLNETKEEHEEIKKDWKIESKA